MTTDVYREKSESMRNNGGQAGFVGSWTFGRTVWCGGARGGVGMGAGVNARGAGSMRFGVSARMVGNEREGGGDRPGSVVRRGIRPKQSLGQNFLRDENIARRIVDAFREARAERNAGSQVVEVGAGLGALTGLLVQEFPDMVAIEIDGRAVEHLRATYGGLKVVHKDVLETDWSRLSAESGDGSEGNGRVISVIGNMPYNIVSQILLSIVDAPPGCIDMVFMMMQKEVADRLVARPRCKAYGILSVVAQLYGRAEILFSVGAKAFYPEPSVTSCMVRFDVGAAEGFDVKNRTLVRGLRQVVKASFGQRRKVLRNCLKSLCDLKGVQVPDLWSAKRAEELTPMEFVQLTQAVFAKDLQAQDGRNAQRVQRGTGLEMGPEMGPEMGSDLGSDLGEKSEGEDGGGVWRRGERFRGGE